MLFKVVHACLFLEGYQELQNKGELSISWLRWLRWLSWIGKEVTKSKVTVGTVAGPGEY